MGRPLSWNVVIAFWWVALALSVVGFLLVVIFVPEKVHGQEYYRWASRVKCGIGYDGYYHCRRVRYRVRSYGYYGRSREDEEEGWERRDERLEHGVHCRDEVVRVVGIEHLTEDGAKNAATRQWQATVRYDMGEKYMDLANARGMRWRCDRSGTNESLAGRVGETVTGGAGYTRRCVILARPCIVGTQQGDREER